MHYMEIGKTRMFDYVQEMMLDRKQGVDMNYGSECKFDSYNYTQLKLDKSTLGLSMNYIKHGYTNEKVIQAQKY